MTEHTYTLGPRIKAARQAAGWTHQQLAEAAGCDRQYVYQIESGWRRNPSLDLRKRLAQALGLPITDLIE